MVKRSNDAVFIANPSPSAQYALVQHLIDSGNRSSNFPSLYEKGTAMPNKRRADITQLYKSENCAKRDLSSEDEPRAKQSNDEIRQSIHQHADHLRQMIFARNL